MVTGGCYVVHTDPPHVHVITRSDLNRLGEVATRVDGCIPQGVTVLHDEQLLAAAGYAWRTHAARSTND